LHPSVLPSARNDATVIHAVRDEVGRKAVMTAIRPPRAPRVVHLVGNLREGGAEAVVRALCSRLPGEGIDVSIVSVYPSNLDARERCAIGVPVVEIGRRGRWDVRFFPRLVRTLRDLRPDIVHAHLHVGKYHGRLAALLAGVPTLVFTEHGDEHCGVVRTVLGRLLNARTTRFITFTHAQRDALAANQRVPRERIAVIPNGLEPDVRAPARRDGVTREALGIAPDALVLFVPARLCRQKNQLLALDALARARDSGSGWRLLLAGSGPDADDLLRHARRLGVEGAVHFLGFRNDTRDLYQLADVFLMTSLWERMPLALGEAMLARIPVVSTPWEGVTDFVSDGETGAVSRDWSVDAVLDAIRRATASAGRGRMLEAAAVSARQRFDISATARRHAELYRELAGRRP
jgi:glycosyltransferase involved in cell wall biosynthesis